MSDTPADPFMALLGDTPIQFGRRGYDIEAVAEQQTAEDQEKQIGRVEEIHFTEVMKINLAGKNILRIASLWNYEYLTQLDLSNNLIEKIHGMDLLTSLTWLDLAINRIKKISGLDRLVNLTWLNLSFNQIEKIEGLDSLQKLEMLNLSNNRVSVVENMEEVVSLTHFCIANNFLSQLDNLLYVRRFTNLFALNVVANPVSEEVNFTLYIAGFLPNLVLLNNRLLDENTKKEAAIKYNSDIEDLKLEDELNHQPDAAAELQIHTDAFVEYLNGPYLYKCMFKEDQVTRVLRGVEGVADLLQTFDQQLGDISMQLFIIGMGEHKRRETKIHSFDRSVALLLGANQQKVLQELAEFEKQHKERFLALRELSDPEILKTKIRICNDEIIQLHNDYMSLELQLISQLEDIIHKLDIDITEMVEHFVQSVEGVFVKIRNLGEGYNEKIIESVRGVDLPVEVLMVTGIKVIDALGNAHYSRLRMINVWETKMVERVNDWKLALIRGIQDKELERNRMRVLEILRYVSFLQEQLEKKYLHQSS